MNNPANRNPSKASSNWLSIVENVFPQWRDRLGSKEAARELEALLRSVPSLKLQVNFNNGEEIRSVTSPEFWKSSAYLSVQTEIDGTDHLKVHYNEYDPSLSDGTFSVRRYDVARWERLYFPMTAAPPPAPSKEKAKPGPKPDFEWGVIEAKCYALMDYHDDFTPDDPDWDCQARLEEALMEFCRNTPQGEPAPSTLREKLPGWLSAWRKKKRGEA